LIEDGKRTISKPEKRMEVKRQANEKPCAGKNQKSKNLKTQTIMKTILFLQWL
jgi:hypothetical protein